MYGVQVKLTILINKVHKIFFYFYQIILTDIIRFFFFVLFSLEFHTEFSYFFRATIAVNYK